MTKCKPPIFGDSAVLKKRLWVTLVIALVLALYGALFAPTWQTRAFTIDAAAQTHKAVGTGVAATDEQPHAPGR